MGNGLDLIERLVTYFVPMLLSLTVHEYSHARMAWWLGDDTASLQGRMSLNPLVHIDLIGTIVIPIFGILSGFPFFGWAKPVPTNPVQYRRRLFGRRISMTAGMALTAAAGPLSNLLFAFVMAASMGVANHFLPPSGDSAPGYTIALRVMAVNIGLCVFNFFPVPPLDGSRILYWLTPDRYKPVLDRMVQYSVWLFLGLILLMNTSFFGAIFVTPFFLILRGLAALFGLSDVFVRYW
ncbi:MAG: site-2 protease family protein [Deltaproteobacteria bacterium]|nr:site-2 protease family protein [Deltaproteobacteria bacterium]